MDLLATDDLGMLGLQIVEAVESLIGRHDRSLDKRASQIRPKPPVLELDGGVISFIFRGKGNRDVISDHAIRILTDSNSARPRGQRQTELALSADAKCECATFLQHRSCHHTLASAWWLQEQLGRLSADRVGEFLSSLTIDATALGRELANKLLSIAQPETLDDHESGATRIQWRIRLNPNRYYRLLSVVPYEQRLRKSGTGWTKGREIREFEFESRPSLLQSPVDARVMSLVSMSGGTYGSTDYASYEALRQLVGQPNVAWDDGEATPIEILRGNLVLSLEPVATSGKGDTVANQNEDANPWDRLSTEALMSRRYRPRLTVPGVSFNLADPDVEIQIGYASPLHPLLIIASEKQRKLLLCELKGGRSTVVIDLLMTQNLEEVVFDASTAARLAMSCATLDGLISLQLPNELSGPLEPAKATLAIELRPRATAGLNVALRVDEPRFPQTQVPGVAPEVVRCVTNEGPVRVSRNLEDEILQADELIQRFDLLSLPSDGPYAWVAATDEQALDLLGRLYEPANGAAVPVLWPDGQTMKIRGEITPSSLRVKLDDRRDWFGLSGHIELEGKQVLLSDLLVAVQENRSLVRVGDREFAQISAAFRKRLQQLGDAVVSERGALRVADAAAPIVSDLLGDDVCLEANHRWQKTLARLEELKAWKPELPSDLQATLRHYQEEGYQWLSRLSHWGVGGVLADDMGLGKTVQTLGVLIDRGPQGPALVVAPTSVGDNWMRETARFAPALRPRLYREHDRKQLIDDAGSNDLIIVSYQLLQRDIERFVAREWQTLVLDEAQFIKNAQTKTAQAIRSLHANWRIGLSGTPLENHLGELWSLFRTLSPGLLGSWERFRTRFAEPIERLKDNERRESLATLVRPFILRRTKSSVLTELPPRTEVTLFAEMGTAERKRYEDARIAAVAELSGSDHSDRTDGDQRMKTLAWLTKLRQLACHPKMVDKSWKLGSAKLSLFMETVEELRDGEHRALVFSQFVKHLDVIREALDEKGIRYQYLDGSTPAAERQRRVDAFQNGEGDLFLISLKAGGTGLNLTAANYVIHLDPWWNPAVEDQATDRAHRIGQDRAVTVYRLVAKDTIEERILELHASKRELVASVLGGTDQAGRLSTEEMIDLIRATSV